jgi:hypothetical protein
VEAASLFSSPNATQSPLAAVVPETPIPSPSQVSSSTVTNIGKHYTPGPVPIIPSLITASSRINICHRHGCRRQSLKKEVHIEGPREESLSLRYWLDLLHDGTTRSEWGAR